MSNLQKRVISGIVGAALLIFTIYEKFLFLKFGTVIVIYICLYEFIQAFAKKGFRIKFFEVALVPAPFLVYFVFIKSSPLTTVFYFLGIGIVGYLIYYIFSDMNVTEFSISIFSIAYIVLPLAFLYNLLDQEKGYYVWLIFVIAFSSDIFAYVFGKLLGSHKLVPELSPKKTIEGSIGGIVGAVAMCFVANYFFGIGLYSSTLIVLGMSGSIASQLGDLFASKIKRFCKIKDFGNIIPGHGGMIDRLDSVIFVTMVFVFAYYSILPDFYIQ